MFFEQWMFTLRMHMITDSVPVYKITICKTDSWVSTLSHRVHKLCASSQLVSFCRGLCELIWEMFGGICSHIQTLRCTGSGTTWEIRCSLGDISTERKVQQLTTTKGNFQTYTVQGMGMTI